jgi:hypothetical protein
METHWHNRTDERKGIYFIQSKINGQQFTNKIVVFGFGKFGMLLFLVVLFASCKKLGKNTVIKGRVLNPITGEGIEGAKLSIYRYVSFTLPADVKVLNETYSDANGNFELHTNKSSMKVYYVGCAIDAGNYYSLDWQGSNLSKAGKNAFIVEKGKTMHVDFHAVPYGKLQRHIKNVNCTSENDQNKIYYDGAEYNDNLYSIGLLTTLDGCIDITTTPLKISSGNKYFHWEVTKNGVTNTYYDTIFVEDTGITTLDIFY